MRLRIAKIQEGFIQLTKLLSLVFLLLACFYISALKASNNHIKFQRFSTETGLSQSGVNDILQDDLGFVWFATQYGLNRFDGQKYDYFTSDEKGKNKITSNHTTRLAKAPNGFVWVLSSHGLDSINPKSLVIKNWSENIFTKLIADGFLDFKNKGTVSDFQVTDSDLYVLINYEILVKVALETGDVRVLNFPQVANKTISGILLFKNQELVVYDENCLFFYDLKKLTLSREYCLKDGLSSQGFNSSSLQGNTLFIANIRGFITVDLISLEEKLIEVLDSKSQSPVEASSYYDNGDGYWLGTVAGLKFYDKKTKSITQEYYHQTSDDYSLSNNDILSLYKTNDGVLWVGSSYGASVLKPNQHFSHLLRKHEAETFKLSNLSSSITQDSKGNIWIGTSSSGLYKYSKNTGVLSNFFKMGKGKNTTIIDFVSKVLEDNNQNLWVLAVNGLSVKLKNSDEFKTVNKFKNEGLDAYFGTMHDIVQDRYSNFWIGGGSGFYKLVFPTTADGEIDVNNFELVNYKDKLPNNYLDGDYGVYIIYEDLQGYLWLGGTNGLLRFNPSNLKTEHFVNDPNDPTSLSSSDVNTIYEDYNGVLWIGTSNGLNRIFYSDSGEIRFKRIGTKDGFTSNYISSIQADRKGFLWISTLKGITRYHPSNIEPVRNYFTEQGLQHNEFYTKSSYTDKNGNLYFGGVNGVTVFNPLKLDAEQIFVPIQFSSVSQSEEYLPISDDNQVFLLDANPVKIRISNFDYISNRKFKLRYRLSAEDEWLEFSGTEMVLNDVKELTSLEIQQLSSAGSWLEPGIKLKIHPAFELFNYKYLWLFVALIIILLLTLLLYWIYSNVNRQRREKHLLVKREKAKQSLLMEEKLSLLHQVEDLHYSLSEQKYLVDKIRNELEQKNILDEVTELYSRGYIIKNIHHELDSVAETWKNKDQKGIYLGIFCIEVDNYPSLKEQYGFIAANEILRQVASTVSSICYGSDIIARWQGPTVLILSRGISKREQMVLAEKIRNVVASRKFNISNGKTIDITTSIGFTRYPFISMDKVDSNISWAKLIFLTETALSSAQVNSLNAWIGIFSNQFTDKDVLAGDIIKNLPDFINNGQIDYVSSIPKSKKIQWE